MFLSFLRCRNISLLSTSIKSRLAYPVPASSWVYSFDTGDIPTPVSGSSEAKPGVWSEGVITLSTTRQRLVTRMVKSMRELLCEDRLRQLNTISLERRRLRGDLILTYNIFHGCLDLQQAEFREVPAERDFRGHDFKLRHRSFR